MQNRLTMDDVHKTLTWHDDVEVNFEFICESHQNCLKHNFEWFW